MDDAFGTLHEEHELLGAIIEENEGLGVDVPASYGDTDAERSALADGVGICDLSGMMALLVGDAESKTLIEAGCSREALAVGECGFGAVLTGDGALASVPLVARTGDGEFLLWDASARADLLVPWMYFLQGIEEQGRRPFAETSLEDVSESLVPLLVAGPGARDVLLDYTPDLPGAGKVASIPLDRIQCLVAGLPEVLGPGWMVFVGPQYARVLWRSLLSFPVVAPVGWKAMGEWAQGRLPWAGRLADAERETVTREELREWKLLRGHESFVGARALR